MRGIKSQSPIIEATNKAHCNYCNEPMSLLDKTYRQVRLQVGEGVFMNVGICFSCYSNFDKKMAGELLDRLKQFFIKKANNNPKVLDKRKHKRFYDNFKIINISKEKYKEFNK